MGSAQSQAVETGIAERRRHHRVALPIRSPHIEASGPGWFFGAQSWAALCDLPESGFLWRLVLPI